MEARIRKKRKPKKRKTTRRRRRKVVLKRAKPQVALEGSEVEKKTIVVMLELTNRAFESSTIYVCTSPEAALEQAIHVITTDEVIRGLMDISAEEADVFLKAVADKDYDGALSAWSRGQDRLEADRKGSYRIEIWSAQIHDGIPYSTLFEGAKKAWLARVATQAEARA